MPNWCNNTATFYGTKEQLDVLKNAPDGNILNAIIPCPEELNNSELTTSYGDEEKQKVVDALKAAAHAKYGYSSWYDWNIAHWGTKWDVNAELAEEGDGWVTFTFDSAWSPPINAYESAREQGYKVDAMFYEPGANYCGRWLDGYDDTYEIPATSAETRAEIPEEINEYFGIADDQEQWEEENEDD
jgi:hypothetical protein